MGRNVGRNMGTHERRSCAHGTAALGRSGKAAIRR
jgi:hypothetical protein